MNQAIEDIKTNIMALLKVIEEARVPDDLRVTAFEKGFDALVGTAVAPTMRAAHESNESPHPVADDGPSLRMIAVKLGLDPELVNEIYYLDNESSLGLAVAASRFAAAKSSATQQIALLVAAGRQAGGWDEWTPASRIRDVAREYGRFDPANFATTVKRMGDVFSFRGRGRETEVRVTRPGFEHAASLARELGNA